MHRNLKSSPEEIYAAIDGYIIPTQRKFFAPVMDVIRGQTAQIEKTDTLIKAALTEEETDAITALDQIPGIGIVSAEQIIAEFVKYKDGSSFNTSLMVYFHRRFTPKKLGEINDHQFL